MARTTTHRPQAQKPGPYGAVLDANSQKHWRKARRRDRNISFRGATKDKSEVSHLIHGAIKLKRLHLKEQLDEMLPEIFDEAAYAESVAEQEMFFSVVYMDEQQFDYDYLDVRACGCIGAFCQYDEYEPLDRFDDDFDYDWYAPYWDPYDYYEPYHSQSA